MSWRNRKIMSRTHQIAFSCYRNPVRWGIYRTLSVTLIPKKTNLSHDNCDKMPSWKIISVYWACFYIAEKCIKRINFCKYTQKKRTTKKENILKGKCLITQLELDAEQERYGCSQESSQTGKILSNSTYSNTEQNKQAVSSVWSL